MAPGSAGPSQSYGPFPPPPARRGPDRRQLTLIAGVILAALIAVALLVALPRHDDGTGSSPTSTDTTVPASATPSAGAATAGVGDPVTDQQLTFTVTNLDCSQSQLGDGLLALRASGRYCLAKVTVHNTGGAPAALDNSAQLLRDDRGDRHEADFLARFKLNEDLWDTINPGDTKHGTLVFDLAKDAKPRVLELHTSGQSPGARVAFP